MVPIGTMPRVCPTKSCLYDGFDGEDVDKNELVMKEIETYQYYPLGVMGWNELVTRKTETYSKPCKPCNTPVILMRQRT